MVISATKEIEAGARAMMVLAAGLFRLDVVSSGDTLRTIVRNLSPGGLEMDRDPWPAGGPSLGLGQAEVFAPSRAEVGFTLGGGDDRVRVDVVFASVRFADRGTVKITAQAIIRQAAARS